MLEVVLVMSGQSRFVGVSAFAPGGPFDLGDPHRVSRIPVAAPLRLREPMLGVALPGGDRFQALPVGHGDAGAVRAARALDAEVARLLGRQLVHADGHLVVAVVTLGAGSEEHTSELQSLMRTSYAVFCLKKKKIKRIITHR